MGDGPRFRHLVMEQALERRPDSVGHHPVARFSFVIYVSTGLAVPVDFDSDALPSSRTKPKPWCNTVSVESHIVGHQEVYL